MMRTSGVLWPTRVLIMLPRPLLVSTLLPIPLFCLKSMFGFAPDTSFLQAAALAEGRSLLHAAFAAAVLPLFEASAAT